MSLTYHKRNEPVYSVLSYKIDSAIGIIVIRRLVRCFNLTEKGKKK
jgi:hypothetical protein